MSNKSTKKRKGSKAESGSNRDFWGYSCILVGALFCICAIYIFISANYMHFFVEKTTATILMVSDVEHEDGEKKKMLTLSYRVGNEMITSSYQYSGLKLDEEVAEIEIHYNIRDPHQIIEEEWLLEPIIVLALGILILLVGLCIKGFIFRDLHLFEENPPKKATKYQTEVWQVRRKAIERMFPFMAAFLVTAYGVLAVFTTEGWLCYVFLGGGLVGMIYVAVHMVPDLLEWNRIYRQDKISKIKVKVVDYNDQNETETGKVKKK